jgi:hypothetical protein
MEQPRSYEAGFDIPNEFPGAFTRIASTFTRYLCTVNVHHIGASEVSRLFDRFLILTALEALHVPDLSLLKQ